MTQPRWQMAGGAGGILFFVLVIGVVLWAPLTTNVPEPGFDGPASAWLAYARATMGQTLPATPVGVLGIFGFLLFAACLASTLQPAADRMSVPSTLVVLAAGLTTALWLRRRKAARSLLLRAGIPREQSSDRESAPMERILGRSRSSKFKQERSSGQHDS